MSINSISYNPKEQPDKEFAYVDLSSVDNGHISFDNTFLGKDAPSRARRIAGNRSILIYLAGILSIFFKNLDSIFYCLGTIEILWVI